MGDSDRFLWRDTVQSIVRQTNASGFAKQRFFGGPASALTMPRLPTCFHGSVKTLFVFLVVSAGVLHGSAEAVVVYNANFGSDTVTRWDTQGPYTATAFISGIVDPVGVAVDPAGNVYVTQFGNDGTISKFDPTGSLISSIDNLGYLPYSIRFDPLGTLYVADLNNSLIKRYTDTLSPLTNWATTDGNPTSIQFTEQGFVLVANAGSGDNAQKFSLSGVSLQTIGGPPTLGEPHDAVTDAAGNIFVASRQNQRVVQYDSAGNLLDPAFISGYDPYSILLDGSTMFVAAHDLGTIRRYNASTGDFLGEFAVGSLPTYMAVNPVAIPEPSASAILVIAVSFGAWAAFGRGSTRSGS